MNWFSNLIKKKSEILTVSIFTINDINSFHIEVASEVVKNCKDKIVNYIIDTKSITSLSILNAKKPDLALCIHFVSYLKKDCCEVVYIKDDKQSEELVTIFSKQFKKSFKDKELAVLGITQDDAGYNAIAAIKNLKRKILIKPEKNMTADEVSNLLLNFFGKI